MMTTWKFPLDTTDVQTVSMPKGAKVLSVQMQFDRITAWALVDNAELVSQPVRFHVIGTGYPLPDYTDAWQFIGTVQMLDGSLIFHVFVDTMPLVLA
jgi:hypothetical protein